MRPWTRGFYSKIGPVIRCSSNFPQRTEETVSVLYLTSLIRTALTRSLARSAHPHPPPVRRSPSHSRCLSKRQVILFPAHLLRPLARSALPAVPSLPFPFSISFLSILELDKTEEFRTCSVKAQLTHPSVHFFGRYLLYPNKQMSPCF